MKTLKELIIEKLEIEGEDIFDGRFIESDKMYTIAYNNTAANLNDIEIVEDYTQSYFSFYCNMDNVFSIHDNIDLDEIFE